MSSANKEKNGLRKLRGGILWVAWVARFAYNIDYSVKVETSRPDTSFLYRIMTQESFYKLQVECMDDRTGERSPE